MEAKIRCVVGILIGLWMLEACKPVAPDVETFRVVVNVKEYDSIYSDKENIAGMVMDMSVRNGLLVASHRNDEYVYSFIDAHTGRLLKRWGKVGEGENEFLDFGNGFVLNDSSLVFMERMKKNIVHVPLSAILDEKVDVKCTRESYPYVVDFRPQVFCLAGGYKILGGAFKDARLGIVGTQDEIIPCPDDYPFSTEPLEGIRRGTVFQCKLKASGKQKRFVVQTMYSDVFEIYQCREREVERIYISPFNYPPQIKEKSGRYGIDYEKSIAGLMQMSVSDELICFIYSSLSSKEADKNHESANEIISFDWNGKKQKKYLLPFPVCACCMDEEYMYVARECEEETVIYRFKL